VNLVLLQDPVVVEVAKQQPAAAHDISIDAIITMFASAGVFLAIAAAGGLLVGAIFIAIRRFQERSAPRTPDSSHVKLRI
jgi:hypothetical protein